MIDQALEYYLQIILSVKLHFNHVPDRRFFGYYQSEYDSCTFRVWHLYYVSIDVSDLYRLTEETWQRTILWHIANQLWSLINRLRKWFRNYDQKSVFRVLLNAARVWALRAYNPDWAEDDGILSIIADTNIPRIRISYQNRMKYLEKIGAKK